MTNLATVYHECGHAVLSIYFGNCVYSITIGDDANKPCVQHGLRCTAQRKAMILLAGTICASKFDYPQSPEASRTDEAEAIKLLGGSRCVDDVLPAMKSKVAELFDDPKIRNAVEVLVDEWLRRDLNDLDGITVHQIVEPILNG